MIDWKKTAELNTMNIKDCKLYFNKYPMSGKKIVAICDNCNKIRYLTLRDYSDLCRLCSLQSRRSKEPKCNKCGVILIVNENWTKHRMEVSNYRCINCYNSYCRKQYIKNRKINGLPLKRDHISKIKTISHYICYDNTVRKQIMWRQNVNEDGELQGIGAFAISKIRDSRDGFGFIKLDRTSRL